MSLELYRDNVTCPYHFMEYDCKKCLLLGYKYRCNSMECASALEKAKNEDSKFSYRHDISCKS